MDEIINGFKAYSQDIQNTIHAKYSDMLGLIYKNIDTEYLYYNLYSLDYSFKYLDENYKDVDKIIKTWCIVNLMRSIKSIEIHNDNDIINVINKTIEHFKSDEYKNYLNDIEFFSNEYSRDLEYLNKLTNE